MRKKLTRRTFVQTAALSGLAAAASPTRGLAENAAGSEKAASGQGLTQFVDVFIGTGGHGHTYPGATVPFGMVQLSPDTFNGGWDHCSGYPFTYLGVPHKTQARVRMLLETIYHNDRDRIAGNEDCGQMSAWYIMSALGFYAVDR